MLRGLPAFEEALCKLKKYDKWIIVCHENPDGDTIGSALALYCFGNRIGKTVSVYSKDVVPCGYRFLRKANEIIAGEVVPYENVKDALLIAVDISTEKRSVCNFSELLRNAPDSVSFDHHRDNTNFAKTNLVNSKASANAEIITEVICEFGKGMEKDEAEALYTALVTDNGNFCYDLTSPESHRCAEILLEAGVRPNEINDRLIENMSVDVLRLWGKAISRMKNIAGGSCALMWLTRDEVKSSCRDRNDLNGLVNMPLRIVGVSLSILLTEDIGKNKLSIRSRAPLNARDFAAIFNGGGHINAAGASIDGTFCDALARVEKEAENYAAVRYFIDK